MLYKDEDEDFTSHLSSVYDTDDDIKVAALFFHLNEAAPNKKQFYRIEFNALNNEINDLFPQRWRDA